MRTTIRKRGNSLGVRIPSALAEDARLHDGAEVDVTVREGQLVIVPVLSLAERRSWRGCAPCSNERQGCGRAVRSARLTASSRNDAPGSWHWRWALPCGVPEVADEAGEAPGAAAENGGGAGEQIGALASAQVPVDPS